MTAESGTAGAGSSGFACGSFVTGGSDAGTGFSVPWQPARQESAKITTKVKEMIVFSFIFESSFLSCKNQCLGAFCPYDDLEMKLFRPELNPLVSGGTPICPAMPLSGKHFIL
jgi:hypothetical protein